jgi:hypothetical protein
MKSNAASVDGPKVSYLKNVNVCSFLLFPDSVPFGQHKAKKRVTGQVI